MSRGASRKPLQDRHYSPPTDEEGSDHDSADAERSRDNESREGSQTRPTGQPTPVDEGGSGHDSAEAERISHNESRERSQIRPTSNDTSFARAAQVFATDVRTAWNRFELDRIPRDGTSPDPIVEQGSTAIYHAPSILQFYFTNTPPGIHTASTIDHPNDNRASSVSNTQSSPGRDTQNPRKRKRSGTDGDDEDQERQGPVDALLAVIEAGMLRHADRETLLAALDSEEIPGDKEVEGGGEGESVGAEIRGERENSEDGEGGSEDGGIRSDEGGSGDVEGEAHTEESPDGDTIIVRKPRNHQSRTQDETGNVTRGYTLSRPGGRHQQRAVSSSSEEDLYGSSVPPSGRRRPDTHVRRDDQSVADDDANQSEGDENDQLIEDEVHQTPRRPHGRSTSGRNWYYASGPETTTRQVDTRQVQAMLCLLRDMLKRDVTGESPLKQSSVPRQEERDPDQQNNQADTRTASRPNRGIRGSPEKQRATLPSIPEERPMGRPYIPACHNPKRTPKRKRHDRVDKKPARPRSISPASRDEDLAAMGLGPRPAQPGSDDEEEEEDKEDTMMETRPQERSGGDESENDHAEGPGENTTQLHPEQIDRHPREPESTKKKIDVQPGLLKSHLKATADPRVADRKKATEEKKVPSAGSEGSSSSLSDPPSEEESEEEQPPVKPSAKRQKTRHRGRDEELDDYDAW
ncbi:hypothetical protein KC356_g4245 [Hortaea werneckii]|nr:hypothetical protein KC356_g4245 [Hortaea werneckii]